MDDQQLMCFLLLSKELSFSRTAELLYTTQPAVSRTIRSIEDEWGVKLFDRSSKQVLLTKAGEIMAKEVEECLNRMQQAVRLAQTADRGLYGEIHIGILQEFMMGAFPYFLNSFEAEYPNIQVSIFTESQERLREKLLSGKIDFVLGGREDFNLLDYPHIIIGRRKIGLVISKMHPLANAEKPLELLDFRNETFATLSEQVAPAYKNLVMRCAKAGFVPKVQIAPDLSTIMLWIEFDKCVSIQYENAITAGNDFFRFLEMDEIVPVDAAMIWVENGTSPSKKIFIEKLRSYKWPL